MQSITQLPFSTLVSNEFLQTFELLYATIISARVVKNIMIVIGEYKFVVNVVLAWLAPCLEVTEEKYYLSLTLDGSCST